MSSINKPVKKDNEMEKHLIKTALKQIKKGEIYSHEETWEEPLQDPKLKQDLIESITQAEAGECLGEKETFELLYKRLGLD